MELTDNPNGHSDAQPLQIDFVDDAAPVAAAMPAPAAVAAAVPETPAPAFDEAQTGDALADLLATLSTAERVHVQVIRKPDPTHLRTFFVRPCPDEVNYGRVDLPVPDEVINVIRDAFWGGYYLIRFFVRGKFKGQRTILISDPPGAHAHSVAPAQPPVTPPAALAPAATTSPAATQPDNSTDALSQLVGLLKVVKQVNKELAPGVSDDRTPPPPAQPAVSQQDQALLYMLKDAEVRAEVMKGLKELMGAKGAESAPWYSYLFGVLEALAKNPAVANMIAPLLPLILTLVSKVVGVPLTTPAPTTQTDAPAEQTGLALVPSPDEPQGEYGETGIPVATPNDPLMDILNHIIDALESTEPLNEHLLTKLAETFPAQVGAAKAILSTNSLDIVIMIISSYDTTGRFKAVCQQPHVRAKLEALQTSVKESLA